MFILLACLLSVPAVKAQSPEALAAAVSLDRLVQSVREFSGEDSTTVGGNRVLISHRISNSGNDLAADYLLERLQALGLEARDQRYRASGRNVVAVQYGTVQPDSIYVICAHYDAVAAYCADDNASGVAAILEAARLLSTYCLEKTLVYAFWDEEEVGLRGSRYFADSAAAAGLAIAGVLNLDMIAYDNDGDKLFDIDTRNDGQSEILAADLVALTAASGLDLQSNIVNPGTWASDHASFWRNGYAAVLFGEAWSTGDYNEAYHSPADRIDLFNLPYFRDMSALTLLWAARSAGLSGPEATIAVHGDTLKALPAGGTYEWVDCSNGFEAIPGATGRHFLPGENGTYAVWVTDGECASLSPCTNYLTTGLEEGRNSTLKAYPNPAKNRLILQFPDLPESRNNDQVEIFSATGSLATSLHRFGRRSMEVDVSEWPAGIYTARLADNPQVRPLRIVVY